MRCAILLACAVGFAPAALADPLTFADAVARAGADAPIVAARRAAVTSALRSITPAGQLPDPELSLGLQNAPVSGPNQFSLSKDFMTMESIGVAQDVPNKAKRQARTAVATADAGVAEGALDVEKLNARVAAARAWIGLYYAAEKERALTALAQELDLLTRSTTTDLASGAAAADAALAARMEAASIANRLADVTAEKAAAQAELERWIGSMGGETPGPQAPTFVFDPLRLHQNVERHPTLILAGAEVDRAQADLGLARAGSQSDWGWQVMYQRRDPIFGDMVSLGVHFSLPLFQSTRQTPTTDAKRADVQRAEAERDAALREHHAHLATMLANYDAARERLERMRQTEVPLARQRVDLARNGQAAGTLTLSSVITAREAALEVDLSTIAQEEKMTLLGAMITLEFVEVQS
ncbi:MAG: transporter [Alphaproteobacteria bacterium]|nr:transporter [Alphaproteobacteria bacterium]